jgi:hypothetical protein
MRFLSIILVLCIVLLSSFGELAKPVHPKLMDCCKKASTVCNKSAGEKKQKTKDCNESGCTMLFSCPLCGFIVRDAVTLKPLHSRLMTKPVIRYIINDLAGYQPDNWKPPRTV